MKAERKKLLKPNWHHFDTWDTGQKRGEEKPPLCKPYDDKDLLFDLVAIDALQRPSVDLFDAISNRRSIRKYAQDEISLNDLSYLLLSTNGVLDKEMPMRRTVPSGGARHAIETYIYVKKVEGLKAGLYRYLPHDHKLVNVHFKEMASEKSFTFGAPLTFMWTAVPYRMSWRYGEAADKLLLLDAGHICQNLYLACQALELGTCAVGAYDQEVLDDFMGLDGEEEFLIYAGPVGKKMND